MFFVSVSDTFVEMSSSTSTHVFFVCVILNVCLSRLIAQSATDQHQSDEGIGRQVVLMEQMISMMESINDRQMELVKQIHSTLSSVDRRMEESKFVDDRQVALMEQMQSTLRSVDRKMEEIYYVGDRQVALLRSIERRTVEANEGDGRCSLMIAMMKQQSEYGYLGNQDLHI